MPSKKKETKQRKAKKSDFKKPPGRVKQTAKSVHPPLKGEKVLPIAGIRASADGLAASEATFQALKLAESIMATVPEPLVLLDGELRVISASRSFYSTFGLTPEETKGQLFCELANRQGNSPRLEKLLKDIWSVGTSFEDLEVECDFHHLGRRVMLVNAREILGTNRKADRMILLAIQDITECSGRRRESKSKMNS